MDTVDAVLLLVGLVGIVGVIGTLVYFSRGPSATTTDTQQPGNDATGGAQLAGNAVDRPGLRQRGVGVGATQVAEQAIAAGAVAGTGAGAEAGAGPAVDEHDGDSDGDDDGGGARGAAEVPADDEEEFAGMTRKAMAKAIKKREKEAQRAARAAEIEANRKKMSERDDAYRRKQEEREAARLAEEERLAAEKAAAAAEEFDAWKGSFTVEEEGTAAQDEDAAANMLEQFIEHIKRRKVVVLDELAAEFGMKTQAVVDRVTALEASGRLTGVIDDRGKFIYITDEEMQAVRKFIQRRGRVSQAELAAESNKLVDLTEVAPPPSQPSVDCGGGAAGVGAGAGAGAAGGVVAA